MTLENLKKRELLKSGDVFEKYTVVKLVGSGGMGAVYLVRHNVLDSLFALKVLFPDVAEQNRQFVDRFIREAKLACKIRHPNLIAVYDAGRNPANGMYYIVMDYVSGGNLRDRLKRTPRLDPREALRITTQIAGALVAAHTHHMVHRDIKPDNIMFADDGTAKLADLGIAKSGDDQDTMLTMASSVFGTPAYMSPEQALDSRNVDSRADIYSLGIVFYEMLAGQRPYRGANTMQILSQVVADAEVPDIRELCPQTPPALAELIAAMTAKKLAVRIPDPATLLRRLNQIDISDLPASRGVTPPPPERPDVTEVTITMHRDSAPGGNADVTLPTLIKHRDRPDVTIPTLITPPSPLDGAAAAGDPAQDGSPAPGDPDKTIRIVETTPAGSPQTQAAAPPSRGPSPKRKRIFVLICAALVIFIVFCLLSLLFMGGKTGGRVSPNSPVAREEKAPAPVTPSEPPKPSKTKDAAPVAGSTAAEKVAGKPAAPPSVLRPAPPTAPAAEPASDPLSRHQIVLLTGISESALALKGTLYRSFGKEKTAFRPAERLSGYKDELESIIRSSPAVVIIGFTEKYAEDGVSKANFENIIRYHADRLRDNTIPCLFVLFPGDGDNRQLRFFYEAVEELCRLKSIPLLKYDRRSNADPTEQIRKAMGIL